MQVKDQLDRTLHFSNPPKRIVSLVPSQTELLVDLGLREQLVGITKFCVHPKTLRKEITVVGGTKQVKSEKIRALAPDIIICNKEENTKEMVGELSRVAPIWVSDISNLEENFEMIQTLGDLFMVSEKASEIITEIRKEAGEFELTMQKVPVRKTAYLIWKNPYMAAGRNTFIDHLMRCNRFKNIMEEESRYPEVSMKDLKEADLVLLSSEPFPFKEKDMVELSEKTGKEVRLVDGEYFSWYGSRLLQAFQYFRTLH